MSNTQELKRRKKEDEGGLNMCKAIDDMMAEAREEERRNVIRIFVKDYQKSGCSREVISRKLENLFSLPPEAAENYLG